MDMIPSRTTLNDGRVMPLLGFGTWTCRGTEGEETVLAAARMGYRLFDTARMYCNEREVGNALRRSGVPRDEFFVTTKLLRARGRDEAWDALQLSLSALGMDRVDLLLIHEPYEEAEAMYPALEEAREKGLAGSIGVSNFSVARLQRLLADCRVVPAVNQVELHVYYSQPDLVAFCREKGIHLQAWSPLTAGKRDLVHDPVLEDVGRAHGKSAVQVALNHFVAQGISVVPRTHSPGHMLENMRIFDFRLSDGEKSRVDSLDGGHSLFGWY